MNMAKKYLKEWKMNNHHFYLLFFSYLFSLLIDVIIQFPVHKLGEILVLS